LHFILYTETYFTESHEWIQVDGNTGVVGITDHAQVLKLLICVITWCS